MSAGPYRRIPYVRSGPRRISRAVGVGRFGFGDLVDTIDTSGLNVSSPADYSTTVDELTVTASRPAASTATTQTPAIDWNSFLAPPVAALNTPALNLNTTLPKLSPASPSLLAALEAWLQKILAGLHVSVSSGAGTAAGGSAALKKPAAVAGAQANPEIMWFAIGGGLVLLTAVMTGDKRRRRR